MAHHSLILPLIADSIVLTGIVGCQNRMYLYCYYEGYCYAYEHYCVHHTLLRQPDLSGADRNVARSYHIEE